MRLEIGDRYVTQVGGGGGFGNPLDREPERVLADVRSGYVSLEAAERELRRCCAASFAAHVCA